jgi:hypothetical protein
MKRTMIILAFASARIGCEVAELVDTSRQSLSPTFQLSDTSGRETTNFHSGEEFDISFNLANTTGTQITYHKGDSGPVPRFAIMLGDSIVATSVDGYLFALIVTTEHLAPGETLREQWRAPNTPARNPKIMLPPASYEVRASQVRFDEVEVKQPSPIVFSIVH